MSAIKKVVFITGASSGIGESLAYEYAKRGYRLVLSARRMDRLAEIELKLKEQTEVMIAECDVCKVEDLKRVVSEAVAKFGRLDVVIANAGFGVAARFEKLSLDDYRRQFETNVFGVLATIQATLGELKKNQGRLALVGSANSYISEPKKTPYCMSKFAVKALADGLYWELQPQGVSVTLICPGLVESEIRKVDKAGHYDETAKDPAPAFLIMPREKAAKQIVSAIEARKKELVVAWHAKIAVWLQRYFPAFLTPLFKGGKAVSRSNSL